MPFCRYKIKFLVCRSHADTFLQPILKNFVQRPWLEGPHIGTAGLLTVNVTRLGDFLNSWRQVFV